MAKSSLTEIGLMFMVNVLFISNFFFVRRLRIIVDSHTGNNLFNKFQRYVGESRLVSGLNGFISGYRQAKSNNDEAKNWKGKLREIEYACCLGKHRKEQTIGQKFPEWRPIPLKLGVVTTAFTLLIATILLSDNILTRKLAVSTKGSERGGFCSTDDFDAKIMAFRDHIKGENVTNFFKAEKQHEVTENFDEVFNSNVTKDWTEKCDAEFDAEQRQAIKNTCTLTDTFCVDDWGASWLCKTISVTLPGCVTALEGTIVEHPDVEPSIESDADVSALDQLNQRSAAFVQRLLDQIDIAGSLYSIYVVITLFFPTPLILFRPPLAVRGKQLFCGIRKYTFISTLLILYWGYEYFFKLLALPEVQIFLKNLVTDPCFLDGDFIKDRTAIVRETCFDLITMENKFGLVDAKIIGAMDVINECSIPFPCQGLNDFYDLNPNEYGLNRSFSDEQLATSTHTFWELLECKSTYNAPSHFIGNETICIDRDYSRTEIMVADDTGLSFWELWIQSGLLAVLLLKFVLANFGVALLKMADPFFVCNGEYESPPEVIDGDLTEEQEGNERRTLLNVNVGMKNKKIAALKTVAFRECLVWGLLTNLSLVCLVIASSSNLDKFQKLDYVVFAIIVGLSIGASICCCSFTKYSAKVVNAIVEKGDEEV